MSSLARGGGLAANDPNVLTIDGMDGYVMDLREIDQAQVAAVGGKAAHLGELARMDGVRVPAGFCVTAAGFRRVVGAAPPVVARVDELSRVGPDDREAILSYRTHFDATMTGMVPGTSGILAELGQVGVRLIALTNWSAETFPVAKERFGILRRFEAIGVSFV